MPALVLQAGLAAIDIVSGDQVVFTTTFVLAPFALAVSGRTRATGALAVLAVALAVASGYWNHYEGSTDHLLRIAIVAAGGGLATLSAAALERAAEQRRRMAILASLGRLSGAQTLNDAIKGLAEALVPAVGEGCWVDLQDPDGESRRLFEHGVDAPGLPQTGPKRLLEGNTRALVPLVAGDRTTGLLGLTAPPKHPYDADELEFFTVLAGRVALVLANARLVTDLKSTQARLDGILKSLAEAVTVNDDQGRTVYANPAAVKLLGLGSASEATRARPGELAARFAITDEHGKPIVTDDLPGRRLVRGEPAPELLTRTIDKPTGRAFWLLTKATLLTDQGRDFAVNIIEDVTEAKEAEQRQRFLAQAGQLLASSLDYEQTLQRVAQLAVPWLADWCAVDLPAADGTIEQVALAHADPDKLAEARELRRRYPPRATDETGVPAILNGGPPELVTEIPDTLLDAAIEDPEQRRALKALGMRSAMIVPMRLGEETLGALTFVTSDSGRRFDETDFAFAQDLALRAAAAVQNARLYAAQRRVAYTLQASLLPDTLPPIPGYTLAAAYQAGELGADVGGDFYDVVPTANPAAHLVFLGDVTGKGIDAAALTSRVRHSIRTAARFNPNPSAILQLVNEILVEDQRLAPVSLVALLVEGDDVTIAAAGHPPPLLRRRGAAGRGAGAAGVGVAGGGEGVGAAGAGEGVGAAGGGEGVGAAGGGEGVGAAGGGEGVAAAGGGESVATAGGGEGMAAASGGEGMAAASGGEGVATAGGGESVATAGGDEGVATAGRGEGADAAGRGEVVPVGPGGILLGVAPTRAFEQETISLAPGDAILLYTDGVTDTPGARDRFGGERLKEAFAAAPDDATQILRRIEATINAFQADTATDDRALLVLRRG
ncbi:SpoIIE family protein phosphatase [Solirubrobacter soli]|uniref:SpoIIE family protein phosphatase n=1 Tax=Solirubrobacter soli TaxID=363832 RepID=UPI0012F986DB|nr:SpoIIE family protein phosphatase [Solirubrobacter soli]